MKIHPLLSIGYHKLFSRDIIRFLFVGGGGFIVNYVMLTLLFHILKLEIVGAQVISAEVALLATFFGYNYWAFTGHSHRSFRRKLTIFHATAGTGIAINSGIVILLVHYANTYYGLALVAGSIVGLIWNYTLNKKLVFKTLKIKDFD